MAKGGFRGGYPGGGQMNMMKQAQKMQQEFMKMQQELESTKFEFTAGGGAVKATIVGTREAPVYRNRSRGRRSRGRRNASGYDPCRGERRFEAGGR